MTKVNLHFVARDPFLEFLKTKKRWSCAVCHRRAGKTVACIMKLVEDAVNSKKHEPRYAYIAPTYTQAKDVAWSYLKEYIAAIPGVKVSECELSVTLPHNGARIRLYGAENYDRLRGLYLDGAVIDEAGDQDPRAFPEVIRPALSDRQGWAVFIGTPKGRNEFHRIHRLAQKDDEWFSLVLRSSESGLISLNELNDARKVMTAEQFSQEYECSFDAAIRGAYYAKDIDDAEKAGRVREFSRDKNGDVFAAWDLGIGDSMALWFMQRIGIEYRVLEYYENDGFGLDHYVDYVKSRPFPVHEHLLPHDAAARELQTGKSRESYLRDRGLNCRIVPQHKVDDRINAVRMALPNVWFSKGAEGVERGMDCLRMYQSEYDDKHGTLKTRPLHNWASHGADAFGIGIMGMRETAPKPLPFKARRGIV